MNDFYLRNDELEFMTRDLKKRGYTWDEINSRKAKLQQQLRKIKLQLDNKPELTDKEKNMLFKEKFAEMVGSFR